MSIASTPTKALLAKLKEGQSSLWRTIENLKPPGERVAETQRAFAKRKLDRISRDSLTIAIDGVDKVPKKRARLRQLSPEYEFLQKAGSSKRPRRASSTPARPSQDSSRDPVGRRTGDHLRKRRLCEEDEKENTQEFSLPSPKLSRIVVDTSRSYNSSPVKEPKPVTSSLKPSGAPKKSRRGLTVSFVEEEGTMRAKRSPRTKLTPTSSSKRRLVRHAAQRDAGVSDGFTLTDTYQDTDSSPERAGGSGTMSRRVRSLGDRLIESLNASKYGAMERRYAQSRKEGKMPRGRGTVGGDPQLGYDWIAGLLDSSESYLSEKDDEYFKEMREFRRVNYAECHKATEFNLPTSSKEQAHREAEKLTRGDNHDEDVEDFNGKATSISSYMLDGRLFPVHMSSQPHFPGTSCPTCEDKPSRTHPPKRCIRVSVPHSLVDPPVKPKVHRRRSFDPSDSMGLSKHCVAGWESARPSMVPPQPVVDLKSSVKPPKTSNNHKSSSSSRGQNLLDTSHSIEYDIRSRSNLGK